MTSLDERLGLLLIVRIGFVVLVLLASLFASGQIAAGLSDVGPISAFYLLISVGAELYRRSGLRGRMLVHRAVLPLDAVYLALISTPSGGPRSPLVVLFAAQIIAVTLLASPRAGLRTALWDTFLFVIIPSLSLSDRIGSFLGVAQVADPPVGETTLAIVGFWVTAVCTAVFSSVSERELRRGKAEMAALAEMASALEKESDEEQILGILLRTLLGAFPLQRGALWYHLGSRPVGLALGSADGRLSGVPVPPLARADLVAIAAWESREPQLARRLNSDEDPVAAGMLPEAFNVVVLPIQADGDNSGIVLLEHGGNPLTARLPRRTLLMMAQFAGHAGLALRNARLMAERERLAAIDGLTGISNRREFDQVLAREVSRAERSHEPLSLVVFDLDHFKVVNDTRGHLGGDEVLRAVAEVLAGAVREMDLVARYGGEEFAIVLPRCDQHDAIRVIERIAGSLRERHDLDGVTLSSGVATIPFHAHDGRSLVAAADEALYESKRGGRNRYSVSGRRPDSSHSFGSLGV